MPALNFFDTREKRLFELFAGHFHQDWHDFHSTPKHVIDDYISESVHEPEFLRAVVEDLRWLVTQADDSTQLWYVLAKQYGCEFAGDNIGLNAHAWLNAITDQIEEACKPT